MRVDEFVVLLLGLGVLLGAEGDHRQQVLDLAEHPLFDHFADLLVARPGRFLPPLRGPRPQRELHHLVAEILGVGDACRLLDLGQLRRSAPRGSSAAGVGILEILVLDPGIRLGHVAVEHVLAVIAVDLQIRFLDFLADELGVARRQLALMKSR